MCAGWSNGSNDCAYFCFLVLVRTINFEVPTLLLEHKHSYMSPAKHLSCIASISSQLHLKIERCTSLNPATLLPSANYGITKKRFNWYNTIKSITHPHHHGGWWFSCWYWWKKQSRYVVVSLISVLKAKPLPSLFEEIEIFPVSHPDGISAAKALRREVTPWFYITARIIHSQMVWWNKQTKQTVWKNDWNWEK